MSNCCKSAVKENCKGVYEVNKNRKFAAQTALSPFAFAEGGKSGHHRAA